MHQPAHDLFGQIPITTLELRAWLIEVAGIDPDSPRAAHYLRAYRVTEKIARLKVEAADLGMPLSGSCPASC